jgi:hypothetical protein
MKYCNVATLQSHIKINGNEFKGIKMIVKFLTATMAVIALLVSSLANATLIETSNGNKFNDLGGSIIDLQSNLEWLDITYTQGRTYQDVFSDINNDSGEFLASDGWRYATRADFIHFIDDFIFESYTGEQLSSNRSDIKQLIMLLGDTLDTRLDLVNDLLDAREGAWGYTYGMLHQEPNEIEHTGGLISDYNMIHRNDNSYAGNNVDSVSLRNFNDRSLAYAGSYLVRSVSVPEPTTLAIFALGLIGLVSRRFKKY